MAVQEVTLHFTARVVAVCLSILLLGYLYTDGLEIATLVWIGFSYLLWWLISGSGEATAFSDPIQSFGTTLPESEAPMAGSSALDYYYTRLYTNMEFAWARFQQSHDQALRSLLNVERSLDKAIDVLNGTGLLATNTFMSAAKTGEIGRGFLGASRDMLDISVQSQEDLAKLKRLVRQFVKELALTQLATEHPLEFWLVSLAGLPIADLTRLRMEADYMQRELTELNKRYRKVPKADARWLQLAEAVKRLLNELINTLYQLELHLQDVLSDMRLLQLGQGTNKQLVEIKDRTSMQTSGAGSPQKIMV